VKLSIVSSSDIIKLVIINVGNQLPRTRSSYWLSRRHKLWTLLQQRVRKYKACRLHGQ